MEAVQKVLAARTVLLQTHLTVIPEGPCGTSGISPALQATRFLLLKG